MEVVIGILHTGKELRVDIDGGEDVRAAVEDAIESGRKLLWITDRHGRQVGIPVEKLAYVEIDPERAGKKVGFAIRADEQ